MGITHKTLSVLKKDLGVLFCLCLAPPFCRKKGICIRQMHFQNTKEKARRGVTTRRQAFCIFFIEQKNKKTKEKAIELKEKKLRQNT